MLVAVHTRVDDESVITSQSSMAKFLISLHEDRYTISIIYKPHSAAALFTNNMELEMTYLVVFQREVKNGLM